MEFKRLTRLLLIGFGLLAGCSPSNPVAPTAPEAARGSWEIFPPNILYVVDQVNVTSKELNQGKAKFRPDDIKRIQVLRPGNGIDLVALYSPDARYGVIIVTTKKGNKPTEAAPKGQ